jgi:hypothetical protein
MKRILGLGIAAAVCIAGTMTLMSLKKGATVVHAQSAGCDVTSLKDAYGYSLSGTAYDSSYYTYLFTAAGRLVSDGAGNITAADTMSMDGTTVRRAITGTYTVNADCTGSVTFANSSLNQHFDFVITDNLKEVDMVMTDDGFMLTGKMRQQNPAAATPTTTPAAQ